MPRKTKEDNKSVSKKITTRKTKKEVENTKKSSSKIVDKKSKVSSKKSKKQTTTKNNNKKTSSKKSTTKKNVELLEYYDLPHRYNQTIVKVLAQTPNKLFVYWDISDKDKEEYIEKYGKYFFNNTKPVLIIHNLTKNYDFEIDINDFANSWYLEVPDSNCDYKIELGRRPINKYVSINNNYLFIAFSNEMDSPNDHILFDSLSKSVYFKNVKNNQIKEKNIATLSFIRNVGKFQYVKDFYKKLYQDEVIDFDRLDLRNPSSSNPTSSFK